MHSKFRRVYLITSNTDTPLFNNLTRYTDKLTCSVSTYHRKP
ncbi:hypothetical protein VPH526E571_0012 [Vibrio phage 526E57-1]